MSKVSASAGIRYGIGLFGYAMGIVVFGFLFLLLGGSLIWDGSLGLGSLLLLVGGVSTYAGVVGTFYKVIADGVAKGNELANDGTARKVSGPTSDGTARKVSESEGTGDTQTG